MFIVVCGKSGCTIGHAKVGSYYLEIKPELSCWGSRSDVTIHIVVVVFIFPSAAAGFWPKRERD
jgi:hypothetical protein